MALQDATGRQGCKVTPRGPRQLSDAKTLDDAHHSREGQKPQLLLALS